MLPRVCAFCLMMLSGWASAGASESLTIDALNKMVVGLGFEPHGDGKTYIAIQDQTIAKTTIFLSLEDAGASLKIYLPFDYIAKDRADGMPANALLRFNKSHDFTFAIGQADNKDRLVLEKTIDAGCVTPLTLRKSVESLKSAVDESRKLWKQDSWPTSLDQVKASRTYVSALAAADAIWIKSPLELHNLMFVTEKPSIFGAYKRRDGNVFKVGEPILTYAEPFGYAWKPSDDGFYQFGVSMDYTLLQGEKVLGSQEKVLTYTNTSKDKIRELMLNLSLNFTGLLPGKYDLHYTLHDMFSDKTAMASIPFEIAE